MWSANEVENGADHARTNDRHGGVQQKEECSADVVLMRPSKEINPLICAESRGQTDEARRVAGLICGLVLCGLICRQNGSWSGRREIPRLPEALAVCSFITKVTDCVRKIRPQCSYPPKDPVAESPPRCDQAGVSSARPRSRSSVAFRDRAAGARASCASSSSICSPRGGQVPVSNCRECPRRMAASSTALRSVYASKPPWHAPGSARRVILVLDRASRATPMIAVFVTIHFSETLRR